MFDPGLPAKTCAGNRSGDALPLSVVHKPDVHCFLCETSIIVQLLCWLRLTRKKFRAATALLHDALELPDKVRDIIASPLNTTYVARCNGHIVAAVVVRWGIESEIELLAVDPDRLFKGIGQAVIGQVLELARVRKIHRLVVGTGNSSLLNITFYQKCGFRLSHIRHNYFSEHYPELLSEERGVKITDMIVFAYSL